ncbi:unnamed protein product [Linum tenue]|uniref:FBD domain-containing protein n=2 Tax=Linum tenue TaxID=586396 RepID=A0AAV0LQS5_9ROSI|nr:unnamed protein product [Linum tenue]
MASEDKLKNTADTHVDRLSVLGDDLLLHILGFLELKGAVGTSALSRRWRYLWTRLTSLHLDDCSFVHSDADWTMAETMNPEFGDLVESVLRQCEDHLPFLKKFRLSCNSPNDLMFVEWWMEAVTGPQVESFEVDFRWGNCMYHPCERIFAMEKLRVLKLNDWYKMVVPPSACFPRLEVLELWRVHVLLEDCPQFIAWLRAVIGPEIEKLYLKLKVMKAMEPEVIDLGEAVRSARKLQVLKLCNGIQLGVDAPICLPCLKVLALYFVSGFGSTLRSIISSSPVLESLVIECFKTLGDATTLYIESPSLKNVKLRRFSVEHHASRRIVLNAPSLVRMKVLLYNDMVTEYDIHELPCLESGYIDYCGRSQRLASLIMILNRISNATSLHLTDSTFQSIMLCYLHQLQLPVLHNLTHLTTEVSLIDWETVCTLLACTPNLVTLVFEKSPGPEPLEVLRENIWKPVPECLYSRIEVIEIKGLGSGVTSVQKDLLMHVLDVASCLKKMILHCAIDQDTIGGLLHSSNESVPTHGEHAMLANLEELLAWPRSSSNCEVELLSYVDDTLY